MILPFLTIEDILIWLICWSLVGFVIMGWDKRLATSQEGLKHPTRVSETTLHGIALAGGFLGIIYGATKFRHKTRKPGFWGMVVIAVLLWVAIGYLAIGRIPLLNP
ncbi:MAG: DUF1294 domain-containing protein [Nitrososphaerota archaeon]|nr:DUF1294 domain-containing protein [Nitrososphaerota archaeon]